MRWRYHYPQAEFPYDDLVRVNGERGREEPEYELVDTGVFDEDRYWAVTVDYAKAGPTDLCVVHHRGEPRARRRPPCTCCPTLWFRNTWAWGLPGRDHVPVITATTGHGWSAEHQKLGRLRARRRRRTRTALVCDNETNAERLWGLPNRSPYPKDGDQRPRGARRCRRSTRPVPAPRRALHYALDVPAGGSRAGPAAAGPGPVDDEPPPAAGPGSTWAPASTR